MNSAAQESVRGADVVLLMTDAWPSPPKASPSAAWSTTNSALDSHWIRPGDRPILESVAQSAQPCILCINKVDLNKDKSQLLPMLEAYSKAHDFRAIVPTSLRRDTGVDGLLEELAKALPEGAAGYDEDVLTNRPVLYFVREYVREAVLNQLRSEVPHAVAVSIDSADESEKLLRIGATIHVEKVGQRKIVVGKGGAQIKSIGIAARERIEQLIEKKVHLELFVRITDEWKNLPRQLAELGYDQGLSEGSDG